MCGDQAGPPELDLDKQRAQKTGEALPDEFFLARPVGRGARGGRCLNDLDEVYRQVIGDGLAARHPCHQQPLSLHACTFKTHNALCKSSLSSALSALKMLTHDTEILSRAKAHCKRSMQQTHTNADSLDTKLEGTHDPTFFS